MSRFLNEPITDKDSIGWNENGLLVGKSSMQGWRDTMEDMDLLLPKFHNSTPTTSCLAVFDGHGGSRISEAVCKIMVDHITNADAFKQDPKSTQSLSIALCQGFMSADAELQNAPEFATSCDEMGSTGLVVLITPTDIVSANVGDSRCIMSKTNIKDVLQLSLDHKPDLETEKQRIVAAGGTVFRGRVCGGVAVSRSFGDFWFKKNADLKPHQQFVTAEPCIHVQKRDPKHDEFLVLCCDGIYDVMSNDQVRKFIRSKIRAGVKDSKTLCELLLDECLAKGSRDNMSAIIVLFPAALGRASK